MTIYSSNKTKNHMPTSARGTAGLACVLLLTGLSGLESRATADQMTASACVDLGDLGNRITNGNSINNQDWIVGNSLVSGTRRAFLWKNGKMEVLPGLERSLQSDAAMINNRNTVVGEIATGFGVNNVFLWDAGKVTVILHSKKLLQYAPSGISDDGTVVGTAISSETKYQSFIWKQGRMRDLGTLGGPCSVANSVNNFGVVVGGADLAGGRMHACQWRVGHISLLTGLPLNETSEATALNNRGDIVGYSRKNDGGTWAFVIHQGIVHWIKPPAGFNRAFANDINDKGVVVGYFNGHGKPTPFVYLSGKVSILSCQNVKLKMAVRLNQKGDMLCWGDSGGWIHAFLVKD